MNLQLTLSNWRVGASKKKSKADAARKGLISIIGIRYYQMLAQHSMMNPPSTPRIKRKSQGAAQLRNPDEPMSFEDEENREYNMEFADHVARL